MNISEQIREAALYAERQITPGVSNVYGLSGLEGTLIFVFLFNGGEAWEWLDGMDDATGRTFLLLVAEALE